MMEFIAAAMREGVLGLAPHYPVLHAAVVGLEAQGVVEFGAGGSTRVILDALGPGAVLRSYSTDDPADLAARYGFAPDHPQWRHYRGLSSDWLPRLGHELPDLDLVLHDGSHTASVVEADLLAVIPKLRRFGLCLVHDTLHSGCGQDVSTAVDRVCAAFPVCRLTLPWGFGLTILRCEDRARPPIRLTRTKVGSPHRTVL